MGEVSEEDYQRIINDGYKQGIEQSRAKEEVAFRDGFRMAKDSPKENTVKTKVGFDKYFIDGKEVVLCRETK